MQVMLATSRDMLGGVAHGLQLVCCTTSEALDCMDPTVAKRVSFTKLKIGHARQHLDSH
jgi:hypothetical protein